MSAIKILGNRILNSLQYCGSLPRLAYCRLHTLRRGLLTRNFIKYFEDLALGIEFAVTEKVDDVLPELATSGECVRVAGLRACELSGDCIAN